MVSERWLSIQYRMAPGWRNEPIVIDREAYRERMEIMMFELQGENPSFTVNDMNHVFSIAAECGYNTLWAMAATAAARGDWTVAKELCRGERERHGDAWARDLMRSIQIAVKETLQLWR